MTKEDALKRLNRANAAILNIKSLYQLDINKFNEGMQGSAFYLGMDKAFLEDIRSITGTTNGFLVTINTITLLIDANRMSSWDPVVSYSLTFDKNTGKCVGVTDIDLHESYKADNGNFIGLLVGEDFKYIGRQMNISVNGVKYRAEEKGYICGKD